MPLGGLITLAVLLPNLLMVFMPPAAVPAQAKKDRKFQILEGVERAGQAGCFLIPFFYPLPALRAAPVDATLVMALALLFYYIGWLRYATKGHRFVLLFAPLFGVPLPMAVSPLVYFGAAAIFLHSWPLAAAVALLALGHLPLSQNGWDRCQTLNLITPDR